MGLLERKLVKKITKSKILKDFDSDPKKAMLMAFDLLVNSIQQQGYTSDLKKHLKENHGWIFK